MVDPILCDERHRNLQTELLMITKKIDNLQETLNKELLRRYPTSIVFLISFLSSACGVLATILLQKAA